MARLTTQQTAQLAAIRRIPYKMRPLFNRTCLRYQEHHPNAMVPYNIIVDLLLAGWRLVQKPLAEVPNHKLPSETGDHD